MKYIWWRQIGENSSTTEINKREKKRRENADLIKATLCLMTD